MGSKQEVVAKASAGGHTGNEARSFWGDQKENGPVEPVVRGLSGESPGFGPNELVRS